MHRIRGQNLFLFILYFLLSFIKHQNAAGVLSPGLRQSCLAALPSAGAHGQGRILTVGCGDIKNLVKLAQSFPVSLQELPSLSAEPWGYGELPGNPPCPWWGWERPAQSVLEDGPFGTGSGSVLTHAPPVPYWESWKDSGANL